MGRVFMQATATSTPFWGGLSRALRSTSSCTTRQLPTHFGAAPAFLSSLHHARATRRTRRQCDSAMHGPSVHDSSAAACLCHALLGADRCLQSDALSGIHVIRITPYLEPAANMVFSQNIFVRLLRPFHASAVCARGARFSVWAGRLGWGGFAYVPQRDHVPC